LGFSGCLPPRNDGCGGIDIAQKNCHRESALAGEAIFKSKYKKVKIFKC
jgi:hypothetical protein